MTHLFRNKADTLVEWVLSQVPDGCEDRVLWSRGFLTGLHKAGCIGPNTYREAMAAVSEPSVHERRCLCRTSAECAQAQAQEHLANLVKEKSDSP